MRAVLSLFMMGALALSQPVWAQAIKADEAEVVDLAMDQGRDEGMDWPKAEAALESSSAAVAALDAYLKAHPHGAHAARAWLEKARRESDLNLAREWLRQAQAFEDQAEAACAASEEAGSIAYVLGDMPEARSALDRALACSATARALTLRGQTRLALKDPIGARDDFRRVLLGEGISTPAQGKEPDDAQRWLPFAELGRAEAEAALGNTPQALSSYQLIYERPGDSAAQALWQAAGLEKQQGGEAASQGLMQRLVQQYPDSFEAHKARGLIKASAPANPVKAPNATPPLKAAKAVKYIIQVGSFSQPQAADRLIAKLKKKGTVARKRTRQVMGHRYVDVIVGDFASREAAAKVAKVLAKKADVPVLIKQSE
jgi:cell division protein FtsN